MSDLLLEIGLEEVPAKFMPPALAELKQMAETQLNEQRISYDEVVTYGTPRRIALVVKNIADKQQDLEEEAKGPAVKAAYDAEGNPTKAAMGFARGQGVDVADLYQKEVNGGLYVFATKKAAGVPTSEVLPELLPQLVTGIHFPKPMRWGFTELRYARPIRWIVALHGDKVVPFSLEDITSGNVSRGHRYLGTDNLVIPCAEDYLTVMEKDFVIADQARRQAMILEQIQKLADDVEGTVQIDEDLLEEVLYLVEYPTALMGNFNPSYLMIPEELVITPMKEHQRYFPVLKGHHLLPKFVTVRNGGAEHLEIVQAGNEKVLEARLADAKFFYDEDLKINLADNVEKLKTIVFQEKLGTIYEKMQRVQKGTAVISDLLLLGEDVKERAMRAAFLAKADLVSNVVYEFPELQGIMGYKYAYAQGEHPLTSKAIAEHYMPKNADDEIPLTFEGLVCSMADKMDTIVGCFAAGIEPTGSQDPYALRRQAAGICSMILGRSVLVSLTALIEQAINNYPAEIVGDKDALCKRVYEFFEQRIRNVLNDKGYRYDVIEAVVTCGYDNLTETLLRAEALNKMQATDTFAKVLTAFTRANNLAKKAEGSEVNAEYLVEEVEKQLWNDVQFAETAIANQVQDRLYAEALTVISTLEESISAFFDGVMVMDENENIKNNRLALLVRVSALSNKIADLTKIVQA
mgnify:FL=1